MFQDLKEKIDMVLWDADTLDCPLADDFVAVTRESIEQLRLEANLCFVEAEDDDEFEDYSSPWERGE